jgi:DNA polymerase III epsilon subunit-like protein
MKVFLDTETMGLSSQYCPLLEIAALAIDDDGEIIEQFHEYINPGRPIPYEITRINHISDKDVANCATEKEVLSNLAE